LHIIETTASITNHILHVNKDHQMPFVGGPKTSITNPRWWMAIILKKNTKSPYHSNGLTDRHKIWHIDAFCSSPPYRPLNLKIQDSRWPPSLTKRKIDICW